MEVTTQLSGREVKACSHLIEFGRYFETLVALDALLRRNAALHRRDVEEYTDLLISAE